MGKPIRPYIPPDAKLNGTNKDMDEPEVEYEKDKHVFKVDSVRDLTKGEYGKTDK